MTGCKSGAPRLHGHRTLYGVLVAVLILLMAFAVSVGAADLRPAKVFRLLFSLIPGFGDQRLPAADLLDRQILFDLRLPRICLAVLTGAALAVAGALFQGLFRNPMADPYVLGTSSGGALGATIAYAFGLNYSLFGLNAVAIAAFAGALLTTVLVYNLARTGFGVPLATLLLSGIAVTLFFSAIIALIMILHRQEMYQIMLWLMGGFPSCRWSHVAAIAPYVCLGLAAALVYARDLNAILLGEEKAHQLGVDPRRLQTGIVLAGSLLVTAAVSVSGIIGFVGLIVPHFVRLSVGADHRVVLPVSALAGGMLLLAADTAARTVLAPLELPVGIITAILGAPFFLVLLRRTKRGNSFSGGV